MLNHLKGGIKNYNDEKANFRRIEHGTVFLRQR